MSDIMLVIARFFLLYLCIHNVTAHFSSVKQNPFRNGTAQFGCLFALSMGWLTPS